MNVIIATIHVLRLVILKNTCEHIVMRNLTNGDHCDYASATASHLRRLRGKTHELMPYSRYIKTAHKGNPLKTEEVHM